MNPIFDVIFPVFAIIGMGYGASKLNWVKESTVDGLSDFTYHFAVPVMLVQTISRSSLPDQVPWAFLFSYYGASFSVMTLGFLSCRTLLRRDFGDSAMHGFTSTFPNTVLLGIPVVLMAFGEEATVPLFLIISLHSTLLLPVITTLMEIAKGRNASLSKVTRNALRGIATNPIILSLVSGILMNLLNLRLPGPLDPVAELMGDTVTPCSLFALGATLTRFQIAGRWKDMGMVVLAKLLLQPMIVAFLALVVFQLEYGLWVHVAILIAAQPVGVT
ncbi:MAG: AEC family transporter, partial [bacterium]